MKLLPEIPARILILQFGILHVIELAFKNPGGIADASHGSRGVESVFQDFDLRVIAGGLDGYPATKVLTTPRRAEGAGNHRSIEHACDFVL